MYNTKKDKTIRSITEKIYGSTLPDGEYKGYWSGYIIDIKYEDRYFELKTEEGVRGLNVPVIVTIKKGIVRFNFAK